MILPITLLVEVDFDLVSVPVTDKASWDMPPQLPPTFSMIL
jgi:hypothetical protein